MPPEALETAAHVLAQDRAPSGTGGHTAPWYNCRQCDALTRNFERQGMSTSDAQAAAEAQHMKAMGGLI